jgi:hypothetical protein
MFGLHMEQMARAHSATRAAVVTDAGFQGGVGARAVIIKSETYKFYCFGSAKRFTGDARSGSDGGPCRTTAGLNEGD